MNSHKQEKYGLDSKSYLGYSLGYDYLLNFHRG
jgi:hypothetical protein